MAVQESSKARQVYLVLRDRIAGGHYADKAALPVEQDLASEHGVSRATVRRALDALETEGLITRRQGAGLPHGSLVQRSVRVRALDGAPFSYLVTSVPEAIGRTYSEADLASRPWLTLLERSGVTLDRATQSVGAQLATPDIAAALETETGSALIALTRTVYDREGRGIEHLSALYRPDRYVFRMDLVRSRHRARTRWSPATRIAS